MKKSYNLIIKACFLILVIVFFTACNDEIDRGKDIEMRGVSIIPNPMEISQKISINGLNFKNATAVVFPDNITVSSFEKVGDFQINVIVPSGTKNGGNITVELPDGNFTIPKEIHLLNPKVTGTYTASGAKDIGPHEKLIIEGEDLINISEIVFPGEVQATVRDIDFRRKGNEEIIVVVPQGTDKVVASMILRTKYGKEIISTPVDFRGGGYIPPEYLMLCGEEGSKTWSWDEKLPDGMVYGNGGYRSNVMPAWWRVHIESLSSGVGAQDALGAKMTFNFSYDGNVMVKTLVDGTQIEGLYKLDMTKKINMSNGNPWSIGRLEIIGGDEELTILGGSVARWGYLKGFDILKLDDNELVLANEYPDEPGTAAFYVFRSKK